MRADRSDTLRTIDAEIGSRLMALRNEARWSRTDLARAIGNELDAPPRESLLFEIEHGTRPMTLAYAIALCRALGTDVRALTGEGEPSHPSMLAAIRVLREFERRGQVPTRFP